MATNARDEILFRGKKLTKDLQNQVSNMTVDMSTSQVTELKLTLEDPRFTTLKLGLFDEKVPVTFRGLNLIVSVVETDVGGGQGGVIITCRPKVVNTLKSRRGVYVIQNTSASNYVAKECKSADIPYYVQSDSNYNSISRDVIEKGKFYQPSDYPSAWTTFRRLSADRGFLMYEMKGKIYFAKPEHLVDINPIVTVNIGASDGTEALNVPRCRRSVDNTDVEIEIELPPNRIDECYPGYKLLLKNMPGFSGSYIIETVSYSVTGTGVISITATTARNIVVDSNNLFNDDPPKGIFDGLVRGTPHFIGPRKHA